MSTSQRLRTAAAVLMTAAAAGLLALAQPAPADAAACPGSSGVTVVVERGALGGGVQVGCSPDGGGRADRLLTEVGHTLTYLQRFPAFVCRIDGVPADDPCVNTPPADAYWGLWWSDGRSGEWTYSSLAAGSLNIPAGGYVAMVWDGSSGTVRPRTSATPRSTPTPTPSPSRNPTQSTPPSTAGPTTGPTPGAATGAVTGATTHGPGAAATSKASGTSGPPSSTADADGPTPADRSKVPKPSRSASVATGPADASTEPAADAQTEAAGPVDIPVDTQSAGDSGLPAWVAPVVVVLLLGGAGVVALTRRRAQP